MAESGDNPGGLASDTQGRAELPKLYKPTDHEPRIRERWESSRAFHPDPERVLAGEAKPYCILIPPPNVTDRLHLGHALNNTLQDVLVRAHRMMGYETLWMAGTDHAGIATQAVVEKRLRKEGVLKGPLREAFKRDEFVAKVQAFKDEYEAVITGQLKAMGCSCDWERQRFTMDPQCARAVHEAFFRLFKDGLIYRGKRLVNWDPVLQTAVADDECFDEEIDGQFYYLRYPLVHRHGAVTSRELARGQKGPEAPTPVTWSELRARGWPAAEDAEHADDKQAWVTVATTRPETYLGDTAVAVNPRDPRAKALRGLDVELPMIGRVIPVIEDDYVVLPAAMQEDPEEAAKDQKAKFATGFLKVTPAHDQNDFEIGVRHELPKINVFAPDATISGKHGWSDAEELKGAHVFLGLKREDARKKVIDEFKAHTVGGEGTVPLFAKSVPYRHSVKHSDRSKAVIEPYLSDQWYVRVTDERMAGAALKAMAGDQRSSETARQRDSETGRGGAGDGDLRFYPSRYAKTFENWHESIRDWCISRQLWWGHRIPVWSKRYESLHAYNGLDNPTQDGLSQGLADEDDASTSVRFTSQIDPARQLTWQSDNNEAVTVAVCLRNETAAFGQGRFAGKLIREVMEANGFVRDPDVLDTWFSSALWPMSTMGWPETTPLLGAFNPSDTLCTAREIITLWVSRMVMFNRYLMPEGSGNGPLPFRHVFIHALIMDGSGQKMSKSAGNGVDPLDIILSHGSDAMRFVLCQMTTQTQDVRMPVSKDPTSGKNTSPKFDIGRNFCNKLWNASRFTLGLLEGESSTTAQQQNSKTERSLIDRWMLSRLAAAVEQINISIKRYEYSEYAQSLYDLLWRDFCDWYIEGIKPTIATDAGQRAVLAHALETIVRLLHPVAPFITEAIWERLKEVKTAAVPGITMAPSRKGDLLCTAGWPEVAASLRDEAAEREFERLRVLITAIREVRAQHQVSPRRKVTLHVPAALAKSCGGMLVETLAMVERVTTDAAPADAVPFTFESQECRLSNLADEVDAGAEKARLEKVVADSDKAIKTLEGRLSNPGYALKAPPAMVQQTKDQLAKAVADRDGAKAALEKMV